MRGFVSILSPLIFKDKILSILLVVGTMFISDFFIGFHSYQFIIYLTLISITLIAPMKKNYSTLGILAIGSSVWFFLVTNFSVWLIWDQYPKTLNGLIACYTMAIPFFTNTVISTCMFTGLILLSYRYLKNVDKEFNSLVFNFFKKN